MIRALLANGAPALSIDLSTATTTVLGVIGGGLIAVVWYFLRREFARNDEAHRDLRADIRAVATDVKAVETDVKQLLAGQGRIEGALGVLIGERAAGGSAGASPPAGAPFYDTSRPEGRH